jgi:excisionase family DNA binding protein
MEMDVTKLLDKKSIAEALGVSTRTVDRLRVTGAIRAVKMPGRRGMVRFEPTEVDRLIQRNREQA